MTKRVGRPMTVPSSSPWPVCMWVFRPQVKNSRSVHAQETRAPAAMC